MKGLIKIIIWFQQFVEFLIKYTIDDEHKDSEYEDYNSKIENEKSYI